MKNFRLILIAAVTLISGFGYSADIEWSSRVEGTNIDGSATLIVDGDYNYFGTFTDVQQFGYIRLGLSESIGMDYTGNRHIEIDLTVTPYDINNGIQTAVPLTLEVDYSADGLANYTIDGSDYRMPGVYKFHVLVDEVRLYDESMTLLSEPIADYIYLESGIQAERYYVLDDLAVPAISVTMIEYDEFGGMTEVGNGMQTDAQTDEIFLEWDYVDGAEYYDLEWTWVDNYSEADLSSYLLTGDISMTDQEFKYNSTRIRTSDQSYRIPQIFAKGYLICRVRGVGRWQSHPLKDKFGKWSSENGQAKNTVSNWPGVITITAEHEGYKNWQYQATYAEEGKKKEVTQYFDGSLRGRQTVTRINSNNQSVVGETVYDNEGRGVIQVLPVPQDNPAIKYYPNVNQNIADEPYSHVNFDWESTSPTSCGPEEADPLNSSSGAGEYYSANAHTGDDDWQQYVPESGGYAFTQVEYTPDNTGRIRRQCDVGSVHNIGSGKETIYYYSQPSQEELNRLFGYKVGFMSRYKKNMVVDANGQASISYLDAQGRVIATAFTGDNVTPFESLGDESSSYHNLSYTDLLNKETPSAVDTDQDNNDLFSTGVFGASNDGLELNTQINVIQDNSAYNFYYDIETDFYNEMCNGTQGVNYPYVYKLTISLINDCGYEILSYTNTIGDNEQLDNYYPYVVLDQGTYTLRKTLTVDQEALETYKEDYLSDNNACLIPSSDFAVTVSTDCDLTCDECVAALGDLNTFLQQAAMEEGEALTPEQVASYTTMYNELKEACMEPCTPTTACDAYRNMMIMDVSPDGQYGDLTSTDILSVYNTATGVLGDWRTPTTSYTDPSTLQVTNNVYLNSDGTIATVQVYYDGASYSPAITTNPAGGVVGYYEVVPTELFYLADFLNVFQPHWAEALLEYHPEYPLYQYAEEICAETYAVNGTTYWSSEEFDYFLLNGVPDYASASSNVFGVDFIGSGDAIYDIDPYFNINYSVHSSLPAIKATLMDEAMTDYRGENMTMLQAAVKTIIYGNNYSITYNSTEITSMVSWSAVSTAHPTMIDQIWQQYRSYYLSYKAEINQYLMDLYGYNLGLYNGCIGSGQLSTGILGSFYHSSIYGSMIQYTFSATGIPGSFPTAFCGSEYDGKERRIIRVDGLQNPTTPVEAQVADQSAEMDYIQWQETGLCPLTIDMERLLKELGTGGLLLSTSSMDDINTLVPDLFEAFSGITVMGNNNLSTLSMDVSGSINGSNELELDFIDYTSSTVGTVTIPEIDAALPWSSYGTWTIDNIYHSYPSGTNTTSVIIVVTNSGVTAEYVVDYTSTIDLNGCQVDCAANNQDDPDCNKEEAFEAAMLGLLQELVIDNIYTQTNLDLSTVDAYNNSILPDYFGSAPTWNGSTATITYDDGSYSLGITLPANALVVNGFDIVEGITYVNIISGTGSPYVNNDLSGTYAYTNTRLGLTDFNFNCSCFELMSETALDGVLVDAQNAFLDLVNLFWTSTTQYQYGDQLPEIDALTPYTSMIGSQLALESLTISQNLIDFSLYDVNIPTNSMSFSVSWTHPYAIDFFTEVEISEDGTSYTLTGSTVCEDGLNTKPCEIYISGSFDGDWPLISLPCETCDPQSIAPISCTSVYAVYSNFMQTTFSSALLPDDPNMDEQAVFDSQYIGTEEEFCNSSYAYAYDQYEDYITGFNITSLDDPQFLTIGEFVSTGIGLDQAHLTTAVSDYVASETAVGTPQYANPASEDYLTWNNFVGEIYLEDVQICAPGFPIYFPVIEVTADCDQWENNVSIVNAQNQHNIYLDQMGDAFEQAYIEGAVSSVIEKFAETHQDKEFHYTLYYYDRAGNLIQTVPPKGVERFEYTYSVDAQGNPTETPVANANGITGAVNANINAERMNNPESTVNGSLAPAHTHETVYNYNSLNQLVYQRTPDGGESRFAYDALGRLVLSQNANQKPVSQYSYTKYDELGRVVEVGELTAPGSPIDYGINDNGRFYKMESSCQGCPVLPVEWSGVNSTNFPDNLSMVREEVTRTIYDELLDDQGNSITANIMVDPVYSTYDDVSIVSLFGNDYASGNTRNRIVGVVYQEQLDADISNYNNATFYDYDVHGNVKHLMQIHNVDELRAINQHVKHMNYEYDLVSGNVAEVIYQKGRQDQFIHRYNYDADNRITIAETSKDGILFEKDSKNFYYDHGPLARVEIGETKVQAMDYAYTIQGSIKAVNGEEIDETIMMGNDGDISGTSVNKAIARDVYGYSLSYYDDDYHAANESMLMHSIAPNNPQHGASLYNGNIRTVYTAITDNMENSIGTHQTKYAYDQLNRIKSMDGYNVQWSGSSVYTASGYNSTYSFDPNGNLETLKRYAYDGMGQKLMDDFVYHYNELENSGNNNRLSWVEDNANSAGGYVSEFGNADIDGSMDAGNYSYDNIGQLIADTDEGIDEIKWTVTKKVREIIFSDNSKITFTYDAFGNRIAKHVYDQNNDVTSTFYVLDAHGNTLCIYSGAENDDPTPLYELVLTERNLYGSNRLGQEQVGQLMAYEEIGSSTQTYDFDLFTEIEIEDIYNETGWMFQDIGGSGVIQANHSLQNNEITIDYSGTETAYSSSLSINTIPGEEYTLSFDASNLVGLGLSGYVYSGPGGSVLTGGALTTGNNVINFTATTEITRMKYIMQKSTGSASEFTLSNITATGAGDIFGQQSDSPAVAYTASNIIGDKRYELSNHLGSVLEVLSDRKLPADLGSDGDVDYFAADVMTYSDYYPYGMSMPGKSQQIAGEAYKFGYQGSEKDNELRGIGNSYTTLYRQLDPRVGRWISIDPKADLTPALSPYSSMNGNPIIHNDVNGDFIPIVIAGIVYFTAAETAVITTGTVVSVYMLTDASSDLATYDFGGGYGNSEDWVETVGQPTDFPVYYPSGGNSPFSPGGGDGPKNAVKAILTGLAALTLDRLLDANRNHKADYKEVAEVKNKSNSSSSSNNSVASDNAFTNQTTGSDQGVLSEDLMKTGLVNITVNKSKAHAKPTIIARGELYHTVEKNESLWKIAKMYNTTVEQIKKLNNIEGDNNTIYPNQKIKVREVEIQQIVTQEEYDAFDN